MGSTWCAPLHMAYTTESFYNNIKSFQSIMFDFFYSAYIHSYNDFI